eukprot:CAMPEP_0183795556 /NCGR_PEP_ID=MMETSP0803_2-20130417/4671_1 /TAXON_ID=195967 /ORGANISM="Crustomastix stigmata, Strain CCMP3273" /LENGTH=127 /DNA_ID=CAMNT_0026039987 /DNA_START=41 /DNA_END=422 /DNA_ORIENTATION=+
MGIEEDFNAAKEWVKNSSPKKQQSNEFKLNMYSYYKQATEGDVKGSQPWAVQLEARAKWDAWNKRKGMSKEEAMQKYIEIVQELQAEDRKQPQAQRQEQAAREAAGVEPPPGGRGARGAAVRRAGGA